MSIIGIGNDPVDDKSAGRSDGFGPDRRLKLDELTHIPIAPGPESLPKFVLESDGAVPEWGRASERFVGRLQADSPHDARFTGPWATRTRARLLRADEQMRDWIESTVLLTFTGSPFLAADVDRPIPPAPFTQALTASRPKRREKLRDVFDDIGGRWVTMRVLSAHQSGYPHTHVFVGTEADVSTGAFEPVVAAHREHSPIAGNGAHGVGAISIESAPNTDTVTEGVRYIGKDIPGVRSVLRDEQGDQKTSGVVDESRSRIRTATILEATQTQAVRIDSSSCVDPCWF